jgi:hypothetical protein
MLVDVIATGMYMKGTFTNTREKRLEVIDP